MHWQAPHLQCASLAVTTDRALLRSSKVGLGSVLFNEIDISGPGGCGHRRLVLLLTHCSERASLRCCNKLVSFLGADVASDPEIPDTGPRAGTGEF